MPGWSRLVACPAPRFSITNGRGWPYLYVPTKRIKSVMFIPGTLFWVLVAIGIATKNSAFIGVAVAMFAVILGLILTRAIRGAAANRAVQKHVWMEGEAAKARVVAISSDGAAINDHPYVDLQLDVQLPGTVYRANVRALISMLAVPRIQPNCEIDVHIDRVDRSMVVVDPALTPYGYR